MDATFIGSPSSLRPLVLRTLFVYGGLAGLSWIYMYLSGYGSLRSSLVVNTNNWVYEAAIALILSLGSQLYPRERRRPFYRYIFLGPALVRISADLVELTIMQQAFRDLPEWVYILRYFLLRSQLLETALLLFGVRLLWVAYSYSKKHLSVSVGETGATGAPTQVSEQISDSTSLLLGQGKSYVEPVIRSVFARSVKAERAAGFSLAVMLILVLVGGMASFGLWVFTHADRIASIEAERNKLTELQAEIQGLRNKPDQELKDRVDRLLKLVEQYYSTSSSYEGTLNRLSAQSQTNLADIAVRVTIAVLTIFLVQVFFAVYKYNRHLGSVLSAKAEALELAANDEDARKELSHEAIAIVKESVPGFGPQPRTVYEQAVGVAEKFAKR